MTEHPLPAPPPLARPVGSAAVADAHPLATTAQIDEAIDYAARACHATVGEFLAAPAAADAGLPHLDLAVEFFVPPGRAEAFAAEADRALARRSMGYAAARRAGRVGALRLIPLPPGAFHQWRLIWRIGPAAYHPHRWSADRRLLDSLLHQARTGYRELMGNA